MKTVARNLFSGRKKLFGECILIFPSLDCFRSHLRTLKELLINDLIFQDFFLLYSHTQNVEEKWRYRKKLFESWWWWCHNFSKCQVKILFYFILKRKSVTHSNFAYFLVKWHFQTFKLYEIILKPEEKKVL